MRLKIRVHSFAKWNNRKVIFNVKKQWHQNDLILINQHFWRGVPASATFKTCLFKTWSQKFLIRRIIVTRNFCLKMSFLGYFQTSWILHSGLFLLKLCVKDSPHIQNWCDLHFVASDSFTSIKTSIFNIKIDKFWA